MRMGERMGATRGATHEIFRNAFVADRCRPCRCDLLTLEVTSRLAVRRRRFRQCDFQAAQARILTNAPERICALNSVFTISSHVYEPARMAAHAR